MRMATAVKKWTLEELHSLPEDENKYELVSGELLVSPPPTDAHETIASLLAAMLVPYVSSNALGLVYRPRAVLRFDGSEVEPDLMVRERSPDPNADWDCVPTPLLVVEITSNSTRRRDRNQKRRLYLAAGVPEYWIVDPEHRVVTVVRHDEPERIVGDSLQWQPEGASSPLTLDVQRLFS